MKGMQIDNISRNGILESFNDEINTFSDDSKDLMYLPEKVNSESLRKLLFRDLCPDPYSIDPQRLSGIGQEEDAWELMYQQYLVFIREHGQVHIPSGMEYESLKDWLNRQIVNRPHLSASQFQRLDKLGISWEQAFSRDHAWDIMLGRLKEFRKTFGHCRVPHGWNKDKQLALWVTRQRKMYLTGKIQEYRKRRLDDMGFVWRAKELYETQWESYYLQLVAFHAKNGHCNVSGKEIKLVSWMERQRLSKKRKLLSADREAMLNSIKFIWEFQHIKRKIWAQKYRQLIEFKRKYGHSFVPVNFKGNKALGAWVAIQRKLEATGRLSTARIKKLEELGFVWSDETLIRLRMEYDKLWDKNFEKLKSYKEMHGTCQVSLKIDQVLQSWTVCQRRLYYEGKMTSYRIEKLNEISFPWSINEGYWAKMFGALAEYHTRFGHSNVPSQWPENKRLGAWVYRTKLKKNKLSLEKIKLLEQLGFEWNITTKTRTDWNSMYNRLLDFKKQYGHSRVPVKWPADQKLGKWVSRMRHERNVLDPERRARLESIEFCWAV